MNQIVGVDFGIAARRHKESPLGLFIALIGEHRDASEPMHKAKFRGMLRQEGYEDFVDAIIDEWMAIKYSTAQRAALPPAVSDVVKRAKARKQRVEQEQKQEQKATASAKILIGQRLLSFVMPNGKALRENTGDECKRVGGIFSAIGELVGSRLVGDVLKPADIAAMTGK